jgi:hypothetical protein
MGLSANRLKLPTGKVKIEVETNYIQPKPAGPLKVVMKVNGKEVAFGTVPVSAPLLFTRMTAWILELISARLSATSITTTRRSNSTAI